MAPTDQKSTKIASTTAQPKPMSAYTPIAVIRKRNGLKAPPATRHRAVLCLQVTIPLFEMQAYSSNNLQEIIWSSRNVTQSLMVRTITTDVRKPVDDPLYVELLVGFYPQEDVENRFDFPNKRIQHDVVVPASWTPKMYLGALSLSLSRHPVISLSMICINGKKYKSLNDVHLLFSESAGTAQEINTSLMTAAAFIHVFGGCHY
jgi:hypothetical protein